MGDCLQYERDPELAARIRAGIRAAKLARNERDVTLADRLDERADELHDMAAELRGRSDA